MPNVLLVGGGAREHAIGWALVKNPNVSLFTAALNHNPGLFRISKGYLQTAETDVPGIVTWAKQQRIDLAVMGMESPLEVGMVDALEAEGIPTVGPRQSAARIETSKSYMRGLMQRHDIAAQAGYAYFTDAGMASEYLRGTTENFALKPDGLTGGTGVRIMGEHFATRDEAVEYARRVLSGPYRRRRRTRHRRVARGPRVHAAVLRRRYDAAVDADGARLQTRLRRRQGAQHRQHGLLLHRRGPAAIRRTVGARRGARGPTRNRCRDGGRRRSVPRHHVRPIHAHRERHPPDRDQRPLRRPRSDQRPDAAR